MGGCRDKYRDFARTGRVRYRSFSKEISPSKRRYRSRSRGGRSRSRDRGGRSRSRDGGGRGGGRNERPYRTRHSLTVENLSSRCSWSELKDIFRICGKVTYTDAHQRIGSGRGEVCFDSADDLKQALKEMNGFDINGRKIEVFKTHDGSGSRSRSRSPRRSRSRSGGRGGGRDRSASRSRSRSGRSRSKSRSRSARRSRSRSRSRSNKRKASASPKRSRSRSRSGKRRSRSGS